MSTDVSRVKQAALIASYWPGGQLGRELTYEVAAPCQADPCRCVRMTLAPDFGLAVSVFFNGDEVLIQEPSVWLMLPKIAAHGGELLSIERRKVVAFWNEWRECMVL